MPVVSVIMAFHRVTPYLRSAVRSVLEQTERDLELVLVDNGTGAGLAPLEEDGRDGRIRLITHATNLGIAAAHNAAVAQARGEFIALLDYDDFARPSRLEKQVAGLRAAPDLGLVSCGAESIDAEGRVMGREFSLSDGREQRQYTQYAAPVVTPAYAGRRDVFARVPYRPEFVYAADYDFLARAAEQFPLGAVPHVLLHYRHHSGQTTVQQAARIALERCVVRLLAARRRAGRPEGENWPQMLRSAAEAVPDEAVTLRQFARKFLDEGFPVQAAFHARQSFARRRTPGSFFAAAGLFARIRRAAGSERAAASRMFFQGPVKALRLHPD